MKKHGSHILKIIFFLGLAVLLVWLTIRSISEEDRLKAKIAFEKSNYFWIILSLVVTALSHYFRAIRWKILLAPLGHSIKTGNSFFSIMLGYGANLFLPRFGEVARCGVISRYEKVSFTEGFGTVLTERALDLLCLIIIFFITLFLEFDKIYGLANDMIFKTVAAKCEGLLQKKLFLIIALTGLLVIAGMLYYFRKKWRAFLSSKLGGFVKGLWQGLMSIKDIKQPVLFIVETALIWLMYILQIYVCFFAFSDMTHLSFTVAMVINVFGSIAIILIPGGTGLYQAIVVQILTTVYFIEKASAIAFAWVVWGSQIIAILILALASLLLIIWTNKKKETPE